MSCTRRNLYNLVFRLKTQNTINYLNVWFKTVVSFQAKSCLSLWITMIPSQIWSVLQTGLIHQLGHNKEEQDPAQPGPVLSQGTTEALWSLLPNSKLSSSDCKTKLTSRNTNRRCFACWGLRLFLRCRWHGLRLWCWQGGRPRVDTCQLRSGDTQNTSIMPPLQTT